MVVCTCNPSYLGGWGKRITQTWEAEATVSQDDCTLSSLVTETLSQKKKKSVIGMNWTTYKVTPKGKFKDKIVFFSLFPVLFLSEDAYAGWSVKCCWCGHTGFSSPFYQIKRNQRVFLLLFKFSAGTSLILGWITLCRVLGGILDIVGCFTAPLALLTTCQ